MGNGQYYDPETGRFLNRNAKPEQNNPYIPWGGNPSSALIAPLALLALVFGRKKTRNRWDNLVIVTVLCLAVGMSLAGCIGEVPVTVTASPTPDSPKPTYIITATPTPGISITLIATPEGSPTESIYKCGGEAEEIDVNNIILFGGSNTYTGIVSEGPALDNQMNKWTTDRNDNPIPQSNWVRYPGYGNSKIDGKYLSGKALQAEDARAISNPCNVIIIAYSAGTESALMYARWRLSQGQSVRAIALLGPTFESFNETQDPRMENRDKPETIRLYFGTTDTLKYDDWADYISYLLLNNVDILVWDDNGNKATNYTKPGGAGGSYERWSRTNYIHWGPGGNQYTNDSDTAKKEVYDWIYSH